MKVSLIISTYNRPEALQVCLASVARLKTKPHQVIIGDDGSGPETREVVEQFRSVYPGETTHVWHEDKGFRLSKIRNKSIAAATGDYIIQIDGDEYLHPLFISDHIKAARRGSFVKGCRVKINRGRTEKICAAAGKWLPRPNLLSNWLEGERIKSCRIGVLSWWFATFFKPHDYYALGGNMAFWKSDIVDINGYDETFEGWGREDDDVAHRFGRAGLRKRDLRFRALCYHLWHPENSRAQTESNDRHIKDQDLRGIVRCAKGLDQYI